MRKFSVNIRRFPKRILLVTVIAFVCTIILLWKIEDLQKTILLQKSCKDCNVILISVSSLRSKSLPCTGYNKDTAPNLCAFAHKGFIFDNHYSVSSNTLDSHVSMFTSLYPSSHRVIRTFLDSLHPTIITLPLLLKQNSYSTYFLGHTSDPHIPLSKGLGRGFDNSTFSGDPAYWKDFLTSFVDKQPFFIYLHTYELIEPYLVEKDSLERFYKGRVDRYLSKEEFQRREKALTRNVSTNDPKAYDADYNARLAAFWSYYEEIPMQEKRDYIQALYDAKIYELDTKLNDFFSYLDESGLLSNSIVVITADHGEAFFEHGSWTHGYSLYNEEVKVPLVVYVPGQKGAVVKKLSQSIDIFPSLLYLLGIDPSPQLSGISFFSRQQNNFAISQLFGDQKQMITDGRWKLIISQENPQASKSAELYDLGQDPEEKRNLSEYFPNIANNLEDKLRKILYSQPTY